MIVLPNNKNIVPVARQVDELTIKHVEVVSTQSVPEALAALVEYDPNAACDRNRQGMEDAPRACNGRGHPGRTARIGRRRAGTRGRLIALSRDGLIGATSSAADAVYKLLEQLVDDDSEIVTVLVGLDAPAHETQRIREHIELLFPHVEVEFHDGGQPLYPYLVGVE